MNCALPNYVLLTCILNNQQHRRRYFPPSYELPVHEWPTDLDALELELPVIDIGVTPNYLYDQARVVDEVMSACKHFGTFQVVNHGCDMEVLENAMRSATRMEARHHYWRDVLTLGLDGIVPAQNWPTKPTNFKVGIWQFAKHAKLVEDRLLNIISQGLGLRLGGNHFKINGLNASSFVNVNRFPPCPDPTKALGMPKQGDPNLITVSYQGDVPGLHIFHDRWRLVAPRRDALVVMVGHQLAAVSNGRLKAGRHRTVVNRERARTTISYHSAPSSDCIVEPARELITEDTPSVYQKYQYDVFCRRIFANGRNTDAVVQEFMW